MRLRPMQSARDLHCPLSWVAADVTDGLAKCIRRLNCQEAFALRHQLVDDASIFPARTRPHCDEGVLRSARDAWHASEDLPEEGALDYKEDVGGDQERSRPEHCRCACNALRSQP